MNFVQFLVWEKRKGVSKFSKLIHLYLASDLLHAT